MRSNLSAVSCLIAFVILLAFAPGLSAQPGLVVAEFQAWLPITDAERLQKAPLVEKDAGAEILLWRAHVVDQSLPDSLQRVIYHYIRLKVFDDKGKEKASTIDLAYREPGGILDISGRTIKADGSILELDKKTVFQRDLIRAGGRKVKVVSFAMPGVEAGAIVEYRWKQTEDDNRFRYLRLNFAREFPVQKVTYFVKPLSSQYVGTDPMFLAPFNCKPTPIRATNDGWNETTLVNVPASREEPYAPSDANVEPWALLYYREGGSKEPEKYWSERGKKVYNELKSALKAGAEEKTAAAQAASRAKNEDEKIVALVTYVHQKLRNVTGPDVNAAEAEEFYRKLPQDRYRTSADIFKSGIATSVEMNIAFLGLAAQAGLDARPALVGSREEVAFNPALADRYFLDDIALAVKIGDSWKVFDVGRKYITPGMLPWEEEGMFALVTDPKAPVFVRTQTAPSEASQEARKAKLRLLADGSLKGEVEEVYSGHRAEAYRSQLIRQSPAQREEWLHDRVTRMFPDAEVTSIKLENVDDATQPFRASYHLDAPRYAQVTGKRILFQPSVFRRSQAALFPASERRFPIHFPYAWKEADEIHIEPPEGFVLDNGDTPGNLAFGEPGSYKVTITVNDAVRELVTSRELIFGNKGLLFYDLDAYPKLKKIFDEVQVRDSHTLSLKAN